MRVISICHFPLPNAHPQLLRFSLCARGSRPLSTCQASEASCSAACAATQKYVFLAHFGLKVPCRYGVDLVSRQICWPPVWCRLEEATRNDDLPLLRSKRCPASTIHSTRKRMKLLRPQCNPRWRPRSGLTRSVGGDAWKDVGWLGGAVRGHAPGLPRARSKCVSVRTRLSNVVRCQRKEFGTHQERSHQKPGFSAPL